MMERMESPSQRYPDLVLEETLGPSQVPELGLSYRFESTSVACKDAQTTTQYVLSALLSTVEYANEISKSPTLREFMFQLDFYDMRMS